MGYVTKPLYSTPCTLTLLPFNFDDLPSLIRDMMNSTHSGVISSSSFSSCMEKNYNFTFFLLCLLLAYYAYKIHGIKMIIKR